MNGSSIEVGGVTLRAIPESRDRHTLQLRTRGGTVINLRKLPREDVEALAAWVLSLAGMEDLSESLGAASESAEEWHDKARHFAAQRDEARAVARTSHAVAKAVLTQSWDDAYNQVPGSKCCEVTNAAWIGLSETLRAHEDHHAWLTDGADDPEREGA